ncbi:MAG: CdaR family protein [Bdellovibrionota bacterium]
MSKKSPVMKLFNNFQYKIAALILGTLGWYIIQGEEILEINRSIQVNIIVPDGYLIKGSPIRVKDATLKGPRVLLSDITSNNVPIEAQVYLSKKQTGKTRILLSKQHLLHWNDRINITIHDAYLNIYMDQKVSRTIPIKEHFQGVPADGYIIEKASLSPKVATVTGLKAELRNLKHINTKPINVDGLQQTTSFEAEIEPGELSISNISVEKVTVNIQVGEKKINKRFGSIPIELEGTAYKASVKPRYVSIVIQGTPGVLTFIKRGDLRAFLDVRELSPGKYEKRSMFKSPLTPL